MFTSLNSLGILSFQLTGDQHDSVPLSVCTIYQVGLVVGNRRRFLPVVYTLRKSQGDNFKGTSGSYNGLLIEPTRKHLLLFDSEQPYQWQYMTWLTKHWIHFRRLYILVVKVNYLSMVGLSQVELVIGKFKDLSGDQWFRYWLIYIPLPWTVSLTSFYHMGEILWCFGKT